MRATELAGLTNHVFRLDSWIVRRGHPMARLLGVDRCRELAALRRIQDLGIGPEMLRIDLRRDITVFRALPGQSLDAALAHDPQVQKQSLDLLQSLHAQPRTGLRFSPARQMERYLSLIPADRRFQRLCQRLIQRSRNLEESACLRLCHNDPVAKNWILGSDGRLRLIDFEFAGDNDPAFDLATWCIDFGVEPNRPDWPAQLQSRVAAYLPVVDALWSLYCLVLARHSDDSRAEAALEQRAVRGRRLAIALSD